MILELLGGLLVALAVSVFAFLLIVAARNREKFKFFEKNAPGLKVAPDPSLFSGHTNQLVHARHNYRKPEELMNKYGPTVGFFIDSRPAAVTIDLDFIKTFTIDEQNHINRMSANIPIKELEDDCIMFAKDEQWIRVRKAIAPAFSAHRIKSPNVQADINDVVGEFVDMIERRLDEAQEKRQEDFIEADAEDVTHRFTLESVFRNFYKQKNVVDFHSEEDRWVQMVEKYFREWIRWPARLCAAFPILRTPMNWFILNFAWQGDFRRIIMDYIMQQTRQNFEALKQSRKRFSDESKKLNNKLGRIVEDQQEQHQSFEVDNMTLKDGSKFRRNMIDYVIDQYREGKLTKSEYFNSTWFLFFAADKTAADGLARLLYNLASHQEIQEKLRKTILESGADSEYLSWVVNETLRLHPPAPIGCSRVIKRDIQTKHGLVPAGTFVVTPARTINRLKQYWGNDADEFRPERWANAKNFHPVQYLTFGGGRRICPGRELALMEIKMLMDALMRKFRFEKSQLHTIDNSELYDSPLFAFLVFDTPTYVRIKRLET